MIWLTLRRIIGGLQLVAVLIIVSLILSPSQPSRASAGESLPLIDVIAVVIVIVLFFMNAVSGIMLLAVPKDPLRVVNAGIIVLWFVAATLMTGSLSFPNEFPESFSFYHLCTWYMTIMTPYLAFMAIVLPPYKRFRTKMA